MTLTYITIVKHHLIQTIIITSTMILIFRKYEHISLSQQAGITHSIIETNTQTTKYFDNNYSNNNNIATVILNPTPSINDNYLWTPEVSDIFVPGLDSIVTYIQSKYATLAALQSTVTIMNNTIQTEINNLEIPNQGGSGSSKFLHYKTTHTDYMFQKNVVDNHITLIIQQHYFTYQRKVTLNYIFNS